jgi:RNA polymerase sigma factor (sigma-70 family)
LREPSDMVKRKFKTTRAQMRDRLSGRFAGQPDHESAWSDFERHYEPPLRQLCLFLHVSEPDVDEILQEVRIKVLKKIDTFERRSKFRTWLCKLTRTTVYEHFRSQNADAKRFKPFDDASHDSPAQIDRTAEVDNHLDSSIDVFRAITYLERIAPSFRSRGTLEAYYLRIILGFSWEECAHALTSMGFCMSTGAVRMAVARVTQQLRP